MTNMMLPFQMQILYPLQYSVVDSSSSRAAQEHQIGGLMHAGGLLPEEVASLIISQLLQSAEAFCDASIDKAVISVSQLQLRPSPGHASVVGLCKMHEDLAPHHWQGHSAKWSLV